MTDGGKTPIHADAVASRIIDGEAVLVRLEDGEMFVLNRSASILWAMADGSRTVDDLADCIAESYGLQHAQGVAAFFEALSESGLVLFDASSSRTEARLAVPAPCGEYTPPEIVAREYLEVLAGICDSSYGGEIYTNCQTFGLCLHPMQ